MTAGDEGLFPAAEGWPLEVVTVQQTLSAHRLFTYHTLRNTVCFTQHHTP
jgi:hypothetical protein